MSPVAGDAFAASVKQNDIEWVQHNPEDKQQIQIKVDLFLSTTCPHCLAANQFFHHLESKKPWLSVHRHFINKDKKALEQLNTLVQAQHISVNPFAVPAIFFCNTRWLGFDNEMVAGKAIEKGLNYCYTQVEKTGQLSAATVKTVHQWAISSWYEKNIEGHPAWGTLIITLAALDALLPCSLISLLVMLSFLLLSPPGKVRFGLSLLFLVSVVLLHTLQQLFPLLFSQWVFVLQWPMVGLGLLLLGLALLHYKNKWRLKSLSPLQTILLACIVLLTVLAVYSLRNCVPNFALVFQSYLTKQAQTALQALGYIVLYQVIYALILGFLLVVALIGCSWRDKYSRFFKRLAWGILLVAAGFLIGHPL